jgi:nitroreductase
MVSEALTKRLVDIGRYAQTGSNSQGVSYIVVSSKEKMDALKQMTMDFYRDQTDPRAQALYKRFSSSDRDIIFRGAPMCILALKNRRSPSNNAQYSLTYIELFAPSLGLGTCWAGFFEGFTSLDSAELRTLLAIPEGLVVAGALLYGYPKYEYHRVPDRNKLEVQFR